MQVAVALPIPQYTPQYQGYTKSPTPVPSASTLTAYNSTRNLNNTQDSAMSGAPPILPAESTDPMYAHLPTYRFPAGPSRSGSAPATNLARTGSQLFARNKPALPVAPPMDQMYEERLQHSPTMSPVPSLQASSSTVSSIASQSLLKPALPIITFPNAPLPEYEVENVYPSGMVSQLQPEPSHGISASGPVYQAYNASPIPEATPWGSLSPMKVAPSPQQILPQTPNRFADYQSPHQFDLNYSPAHISPSTYLPSSAYLPSSSGTFGGPPLSTNNIPRSAPSTPLGRQDARFLGKAGWPSGGLPNPLPSGVPQTEPRMRTDFSAPLPSSYTQFSVAQPNSGYYSADEYERDTSPLYMSTDSTTSANAVESRYIPYARPTKLTASLSKRSSPNPLDASASKRMKRSLNDLPTSKQPLAHPSSYLENEAKPKQQRCKIACAACRKTRLKCEYSECRFLCMTGAEQPFCGPFLTGDGGNPCTSCIEKQLKANPMQSEAEAQAHIRGEGTCVYENFVRRRGKGKKTLEKERHDQGSARDQASRSGSSEHPGDGQMPLPLHAMNIEGLDFRHFSQA